MAAFRTLLIAMLTVLAGYTPVVISRHGLGLLPVFFGDMAAMGWPGQFNPFRKNLAKKMGASCVIDPSCQDPVQIVLGETDGRGAEVVLEMSGNPQAIRQGFQMLSRGGRMSLLGIPSEPVTLNLADDIIFRGALVQGINGRRVFETWYKMQGLVNSAVVARLSGARRVVGFDTASLREPSARWLYSEQAGPAGRGHVVARNLGILRVLGIETADWEFPLHETAPSPGVRLYVSITGARGSAADAVKT